MPRPLVVAFFGDSASSAQLSRLVHSSHAPVVAVAFDLGDGASLAEVKAAALAAGAARCHALDVRDDFVRAVVFPAARRQTAAERYETFAGLRAAFEAQAVRRIAEIERGTAVIAEKATAWIRGVRPGAAGPATLALTVEGGEPVALNDIPMTPCELVECLETIAGVPAIEILHQVFGELDAADAGHVVLKVEDGVCAFHSAATV